MNNDQRAALRRLRKDTKRAFKLVKALNREVARSSLERSIFCSTAGEFYIAWQPVSPFDKRVTQLQACELDLDIGEGCEHETFDDVDDEFWENAAVSLQEDVSALLLEAVE